MIINSSIMLLKPGLPPILNGAVAYRQGIVLAVGPAEKIIQKYPGHKVIRLHDRILMPGLVNVHTHLELPPLLKSIQTARLSDWVINLIRAKKVLDTSDYAAATRDNVQTLMKTGTTTVAEICTHNASPGILKQSGLRATIFHEIISMNPALPLPRVSSLVSRQTGIIRNGISPHSPYTVSERMLSEISKIAREKKAPVCMHLGESRDEIRLLQGKKSGFDKLYQAAGWDRNWAPLVDSPFDYLRRIGLLNRRFLAVHAVETTELDIAIMKKSGISVAHCPRSNRCTGAGKMRLKRFLDAGITVGIGTDSLASSPNLNMWDEMRYTYKIHKRDGITPADIFQLATINGAKALGIDNLIGSLEPGKYADLIAVPFPVKNTGEIYSDLLRETKSCIMAVVNGKIIYKE